MIEFSMRRLHPSAINCSSGFYGANFIIKVIAEEHQKVNIHFSCWLIPRRVGQRNFTYSLSQTRYVTLSIHTAPANRFSSIFQFWNYAEICMLSRLSRLDTLLFGLAHPLRSVFITRTSSLLRDDPPLIHASILSPFVGHTYRVFS